MSPSTDVPQPPIRLHLLPEALDRNGEPQAAPVLPAEGGGRTRRAVTLLFASVSGAVAEKRRREAAA